jgi:D-glycero-D-manno-heptose 1,7-bisphosphate phosphatase
VAGRRAVFLDRDGTLIPDAGYLSDPEAVELLPGVVQALTLLRKEGLALVLVSNQSGVGRGLFTRDDLVRVHERLIDLLTTMGSSWTVLTIARMPPGSGVIAASRCPRCSIRLRRNWG